MCSFSLETAFFHSYAYIGNYAIVDSAESNLEKVNFYLLVCFFQDKLPNKKMGEIM